MLWQIKNKLVELSLLCLCVGEVETVGEGDKVVVTATPPEMKELHERRGLWDPDMVKVSIHL